MDDTEKQEQAQQGNDASQNQRQTAFTVPVLIAWSVIIFTAIVSLFARDYVTEHSPKIRFVVDAVFSFAALIVVAMQVVIYKQQRDAMWQQWRVMREQLNSM